MLVASDSGETRLGSIECEVILGEWTEGYHPLACMSPYQSADWRRIWAQRNEITSDENAVLTIRRNGRLTVILPLRITNVAGARAGLIDDGGTGNLNAPIVADLNCFSDSLVSEGCIRNALVRAQLNVDLLYLEKMPCTFMGFRNPFLNIGNVRKYRTPIFRGKVHPDIAEWEHGRFSSAQRKMYRRRARQLEELLGPSRIFRAGNEAEIDLVLSAFDRQRMEAHRARRVPHVFHRAQSREALREIARLGLSSNQGFHLYALEAGGRICAVSGTLVLGNYQSGFMTSYEGSLRRFGPGKFLQTEVIRSLATQGVTEFDLGLGDDSYKRAWAEREWLVNVAMPITARGHLAASYLQAENYLLKLAKSSSIIRSILTSIRFRAF